MDAAPATAAPLTSTEMLARMVAFDTNRRNPHLPLVEFARDWLHSLGVACRVNVDASGQKANLHALIGPQVPGGIALSGHVDTVPVDGQAWSSDPFVLRRAEGRLYARGSTDMKGFVACCLAAVPALLARGLKRPIHLFITHDEETDMAGARRLIGDLAQGAPRPEFCIVGEPSLMQPILAHKGRLSLRVLVRGRTGHSSEPDRGVNAVHAAAEAVAWVAAQARARARTGPFAPAFDPPFTTLHVGTIAGGTMLNIIPERAEFTMECRAIPGDDALAEVERLRAHIAADIEPAMHATDPATGFTLEMLDNIPGMSLDPGHELTTLVKQLTGSNSTGFVSYGTEGGLYQQAGIPTIICGPGAIAQAHKADEYIAESQLAACDSFIRRLADRLAT
jgi:acetylornithine deacetylase